MSKEENNDEEIKIGDEVIHNTERYIVTAVSNGSYFCLREDGKFLGEYFKSVLEKTGKYFIWEEYHEL